MGRFAGSMRRSCVSRSTWHRPCGRESRAGRNGREQADAPGLLRTWVPPVGSNREHLALSMEDRWARAILRVSASVAPFVPQAGGKPRSCCVSLACVSPAAHRRRVAALRSTRAPTSPSRAASVRLAGRRRAAPEDPRVRGADPPAGSRDRPAVPRAAHRVGRRAPGRRRAARAAPEPQATPARAPAAATPMRDLRPTRPRA